jgi:hypothetical protein
MFLQHLQWQPPAYVLVLFVFAAGGSSVFLSSSWMYFNEESLAGEGYGNAFVESRIIFHVVNKEEISLKLLRTTTCLTGKD